MSVEILNDEERASFLGRLVRGTESNKIKWTAGRDEFTFVSTIGRFLYVVSSDDRDDVPPYTFRIFAKSASEEDRASEIATWDWDRNGFALSNDPMQTLYLTVKRTTLGLDRILNDMLSDLAEIDGESASLELPQSESKGLRPW